VDEKPSIFTRLFALRHLFLWGNILLFLLFGAVLMQDQVRGWKDYQKEFKKLELERTKAMVAAATTDEEKARAAEELKAAQRMPMEIRQLVVPDFDAVDRCTTCHLGYDPLANPTMATNYDKHPFKAAADSTANVIHQAHNVEKFGCTVCHGGQGIATEVKAAHGRVMHWDQPLMTGTLLQASCAKCHDNIAELKVNGQVYAGEIIRAKQLFREHGCIGCHQIGGDGGVISVDLKEETAIKPLSRIDFSTTGLPHEEWTLANWIKVHFVKDPADLVPGDPHAAFNAEPIPPSAMPPFIMPEADADALTAYILSMNRSKIRSEYVKTAPPAPEPAFAPGVAHGRYVYEKYGCAACHGPEARGGIRNYNYQYGGTPNLRRAVATYSRDEIREKISEGVAFVARNDPHGPNPPLYMPAWKAKIKGQELEDLISYLQSLRE
jgi:mono/diheme cytochrome c family protein